jgi:ATP-dependent exoDNAse (exonuclease V) alpha subunit
LIDASDAADAKLVLVGDPRQLPEIEAGGALAALVSRIGATELTENRRQVDPSERAALAALRQGHSEVALATYERAGRVHTAPCAREAQVALVQSWATAFGQGRNAVMLAVARQEVVALNELARAELRHLGLLGPDVVEVEDNGFALGDRVVCLRNDHGLDVLNGTTGTVVSPLGTGVTVSTTDGERFLPASYLEAGHLGYGYALTVHKAQGLTVDRAYVLATASLTQEAGYVALSRAREASELFVPLEHGPEEPGHDPRPCARNSSGDLARQLATSRAKQLATAELERSTAQVDISSAGSASSLHASAPSLLTTGERDRPRIYREVPQIGVGGGSQVDDPTSDQAEPGRRQRSLGDAMNLAHEAQERVEAERDRRGRSRPPPEHDRSWGLGR